MSKLNDPRAIDYQFRVFLREDIVWLYDEASRTYPCTATPHIYAEPLYDVDGEDISGCSPGYFSVSRGADPAIAGSAMVVSYPKETTEYEAWDDAREEAHANHRI